MRWRALAPQSASPRQVALVERVALHICDGTVLPRHCPGATGLFGCQSRRETEAVGKRLKSRCHRSTATLLASNVLLCGNIYLASTFSQQPVLCELSRVWRLIRNPNNQRCIAKKMSYLVAVIACLQDINPCVRYRSGYSVTTLKCGGTILPISCQNCRL